MSYKTVSFACFLAAEMLYILKNIALSLLNNLLISMKIKETSLLVVFLLNT